MAVIRGIQSSVGLQTGGVPNTRVDDGIGRGLQQLGGAISQASSVQHEMAMREERMKMEVSEFKADQGRRRFETDMANALANQTLEMDPSGEGFTEAISRTFNERAEQFMTTVPESLRPKFSELIATSRNDWLHKAAATEIDQRRTWVKTDIDERQNQLAGEVMQNPGMFDGALEDIERSISLAPNLSPAEREAMVKSARDMFLGAKAENYLRTDPTRLVNPDVAEQPVVVGNAPGLGRIGNPDIGNVRPEVMSRFQSLQNALGKSLPIVSGYRDPARNNAAGGARQSRHMQGDALDLDVSKFSEQERIEIIRQASAMGFTGIGVYGNSIHIDTGNRRAWGPTHKGDSVPAWAQSAIAEHMEGAAKPALDGRPRGGDPVEDYVNRVVGIESSGDPNAQSSRSSAAGLGGFIDSTWVETVRKHRPDLARGKTPEQIIALRSDGKLSREMVAAYGQDNATFLRNQGVPVSGTNLYLAHFLGPRGAVQTLKASPSTPIASIVPASFIRSNPEVLGRGQTAGDVQAWARQKMAEAPASPTNSAQNRVWLSPEFSDLPVAERLKIFDRANQAIATQQRQYLDGVQDMVAFLRDGGSMPDGGRYSVSDVRNSLAPAQADEVIGQLQKAAAYGADVRATRFATPDELSNIIEERRALLSSPESYRENRQNLEGLSSVIAQRNQALLDDPSKYTLQNEDVSAAFANLAQNPNDPEAASQFAAATLALQERLGLQQEEQRIMPKSGMDAIVRGFKRQGEGGQNAAQMMATLAEQWGDRWPQIFREMAEELPGATMVVGAMDRPDQRRAAEELAEAINEGAKAYTDILPTDVVTDLRRAVKETIPEVNETLLGLPGGAETANAISEAVDLLALRYTAQGDSPGRAVARAYGDIVTKKYNFQDGYRVPKDFNSYHIGIGAKEIMSRSQFLDLDLPDNVSLLPDEDTRAAWHEIVSSTGRWMTRPDEKGLDLYADDMSVVTSNGRPVTFTWDEILNFESIEALQPGMPQLDDASREFLDRMRDLDEPFAPMWRD